MKNVKVIVFYNFLLLLKPYNRYYQSLDGQFQEHTLGFISLTDHNKVETNNSDYNDHILMSNY